MPEHQYIPEPYKGMSTRYDCPGCGKRKEFTRYIDTETGEHLAANVGICNRKVECGYHYPPKQYFEDNRYLNNAFQTKIHMHSKLSPKIHPAPVSYVPLELFKASLKRYAVNNFVQFLCTKFGKEIITGLIERYYIGTSKHWGAGASVFWQIDISGKIRTGKIMLYDPGTGKRVKEPIDHFYWVHNDLKPFNLKQCLFGEHLLKGNAKPVFIFESEKTAIIASVYLPEYLCLACGGFEGLNSEKCKVLQGRTVGLYPDLSKPDAKVNCFQVWSSKAKELSSQLPGTRFNVSDFLERNATQADKEQGLDLADFLIHMECRSANPPIHPIPPHPEIEQPQCYEIETVPEDPAPGIGLDVG
jgi:hypothetical protein